MKYFSWCDRVQAYTILKGKVLNNRKYLQEYTTRISFQGEAWASLRLFVEPYNWHNFIYIYIYIYICIYIYIYMCVCVYVLFITSKVRTVGWRFPGCVPRIERPGLFKHRHIFNFLTTFVHGLLHFTVNCRPLVPLLSTLERCNKIRSEKGYITSKARYIDTHKGIVFYSYSSSKGVAQERIFKLSHVGDSSQLALWSCLAWGQNLASLEKLHWYVWSEKLT